MKATEIVISRKLVYRIVTGLVILVALLLFGGKFSIPGFGQSPIAAGIELVAGSTEKFAFLSGQDTQRSVEST